MSFNDLLDSAPNAETQLIFAKGYNYLDLCMGRAACFLSGGSDSDIMLDILYKLDIFKKIEYVFFDTGIEYEATKQHLNYLENKYGIQIKRVKAIKTVPTSCREYGVPWFSKFVSEMMGRLQNHNFEWEDEPFDILIKRYPKCSSALKWWCNMNGEKSSFNISKNKLMKEFIIANPPNFRISNKCCLYAKKNVGQKYCKENNIELAILGLRKSEGGIRSFAYDTCFSDGFETNKSYSEWRPLFWLNDSDKEEYKIHNNITYSDCYEIYGLNRTGCFGCPFGSNFESELIAIEEYEPNLFKAANNIFGKSYEYTRKYREFKQNAKTNK